MFQELLTIIALKIMAVISAMGYWGIALCMAIESCNIPLPSEIIQPFAGYLVSSGRFAFIPAAVAGAVGGTLGSIVSYYLGYYLMDSPRLFWVSEGKRAMLTRWFERYGQGTVFFGRLLPVIRTFISLPAGAAKMRLGRFILYTFAGSLIWSVFLTYLGWMLGENWRILSRYFERADLIVIFLGIAGLFYLVWRGRRRHKKNPR